MKTAIIKITDLSCAACASRVEKALQKTEGVASASVNLATANARVEYDERSIDVDNLLEAIRRAGYTPVLRPQQIGRLNLVIEGMT